GPLLVIGWFLLNATQAVNAGAGADWPKVVGWAGVLAVMFLIGNLNAWSPHGFYFERLASMFAIRRLFFRPDHSLNEPSVIDPSCVVEVDMPCVVKMGMPCVVPHGSVGVGVVPWPLRFGLRRRRRSQDPEYGRQPEGTSANSQG